MAIEFMRYYTSPAMNVTGQSGTWYGEYDGTFSIREFIEYGDHAMVAPFDFGFRGPCHPTKPPDIEGIAVISFQRFEELWERLAQPRMHMLAEERRDSSMGIYVQYVRGPFPAALKGLGEGSSMLYYEFADDVARRHFEVFEDHAVVAPYDVGTPEVSADEMMRAVLDGLNDEGEPIDPRLRPVMISHAEFEHEWARHALPRLRALAGLPPA